MFKKRFVGLCGVAVALGGCTLAPKYERPEAPIPAQLPVGAEGASRAATSPVQPAFEISWRVFLADERLAAVVEQAIENSRDLRIAALNVQRARALYGVQRAELLPAASAGAGMIRHRTPGDLTNSGEATTTERWDANLGVASWEIDFFGRIRSLSDAALQQYFATEEAHRSTHILLVSSVAQAYLTLGADLENMRLAETTLKNQEGALALVRRRYELGMVPELDVHRAQTQVDTARADVALYSQRVALDRNALELLVGAPIVEQWLPQDLNTIRPPADIPVGLSSEVLLQRPDVLAAEHRLMASYANIGAARAAFFPRISLTAAVGTASDELSGLFLASSRTWSYAPQIVMPIFDDRVWAAKKVTEEDRRIALADYERAIQASFRNVADALAVQSTVDEQLAAQESLVQAVEKTYRLASLRYERGIDSYLSVLDAQRSLYAAQQGLVAVRLARLVNRIGLYAALGGGWER